MKVMDIVTATVFAGFEYLLKFQRSRFGHVW